MSGGGAVRRVPEHVATVKTSRFEMNAEPNARILIDREDLGQMEAALIASLKGWETPKTRI
jgi:hypothetical protein